MKKVTRSLILPKSWLTLLTSTVCLRQGLLYVQSNPDEWGCQQTAAIIMLLALSVVMPCMEKPHLVAALRRTYPVFSPVFDSSSSRV